MDIIDYSEIKELLDKYEGKFSISLNSRDRDLIAVLINKVDDLDEISKEIVSLLSQLLPENAFAPDENGVVTFGPFKIPLVPADPNVPIKLDNVTVALPDKISKTLSDQETIRMEKKLKRAAVEFYHAANKAAQLVRRLPAPLNSFECSSVWSVRNYLIEHSEQMNDRPIYDSFSYSKNEGPYIKGVRKGTQMQYMDEGFRKNSEEFISKFKKVVQKALN